MKKMKLAGCGTALVTPFSGTEVDCSAFEKLVDRQVKAGIDFLVPLGTTGETPCLTDNEKLKILELTMAHRGDCPVVAGCGTNSLKGTIEGIARLDKLSPDAFLVVVPYYNKPVQQGLYEYFKAVAESTDKGIVLYNVPGRTGANLMAETTLKLAEIGNVIAVKEASGNYSQISEIIRNAPEGFSVLSGNDDETLSLMATGAAGVVSVASNIVPEEMVAFTSALSGNDIVEARRLHHRLSELFRNCFVESNPIPVKAALSLMGLIENNLRLPLTAASSRTVEIMKHTLDNLFVENN